MDVCESKNRLSFEVDHSILSSVVAVSRMTGNGGSQSFKRRASGVAAEIEAKYNCLTSSAYFVTTRALGC